MERYLDLALEGRNVWWRHLAGALTIALFRLRRGYVLYLALSIKAVPDGRTAENLGVERESTGVVFGEMGLILTIGYLILEAGAAVVLHVLHKKAVRQLTVRSMDRMAFLRQWRI